VEPEAPAPEKGGLSLTQVVASTLAAVTATAALSLFGVAGTVVGAAVASILTVVGNHLYTESIRRTRAQVLARTTGIRAGSYRESERRTLSLGSRKRLILSVGALFLAILVAVTAFEVLTGRTLSETVHGQPGHHRLTVEGDAGSPGPSTPASHTSTTGTTGKPSGTGTTSTTASGLATSSSTTSPGPTSSSAGTGPSTSSSAPASSPPATTRGATSPSPPPSTTASTTGSG